ncbi:hypothetical protein F0L17_05990 [Streptomyces sp. TRM43335]|uniref:Uncharacterized protein n=1 Tax=Streptomyces taklimakanensis TaxID=2569853 RepID=A0A6G2B9W5_9ACTN|nr:hypothetical protein [Streptomyces taklimakanensis]MTE18692.1 hypothetical protein [Streptomyces taklimakanensis]
MLVFSGACTAPGEDGAERAAAQAVLDRQADAVRGGDAGAYLATVDPRAEEYRADQRRVFRNLARLRFDHWSYRVTAVGGDAFPLPDADGGGGTRGAPRRLAVRAELRYRVEGYDPVPVRDVEHLTLTRRAGRWYVSGDDGGEPRGQRSTEQPWEQGELTVVRGERSLVLGSGRPEADLRALAEDADRAVPAVEAVWPEDWPRRVLVLAPASVERLAGLLGGEPSSYQGIAAVTTGEAGGGGRTPAERVVVNPETYWLLGEDGRRIVMTHEVTHVATRAHTTGSTPMWLSEGFADWVGYRGTGRRPTRVAPELTAAVRGGETPRRLPTDEDFDFAGDAERLALAYEGGWLLCRMVAGRWGEEKLVELYLATGRAGEGTVDFAVREVLGLDVTELTERWRAYLGRELGRAAGE